MSPTSVLPVLPVFDISVIVADVSIYKSKQQPNFSDKYRLQILIYYYSSRGIWNVVKKKSLSDLLWWNQFIFPLLCL